MADSLPTNNDPSNQIRFDTASEADARRALLTEFIWPTGLPTSRLPMTSNIGSGIFNSDLNGINASLVSQVTRLDADVSGYGFYSTSYLLTPANAANANRMVIVHQGHSGYDDRFNAGVGPTVNALLQQGFSVNVMQMPMLGWNSDNTASIPGQGFLTFNGHDAIISTAGASQAGTGFQLFLEPVIQSINYFQQLSGLIDISMIGISGGGWTTSMIAALDTRVSLSIPVAGSAPLYYRNSNPSSVGDLEQYHDPLYNENLGPDQSGGGIATWLEIYALGAYGAGREQIMVTNEFDPCCFSGIFADAFKAIVSNTVDQLGQGEWSYYLDSTSTTHQIAPNTLSRILFPALGVVRTIEDLDPPEPTPIAEPPSVLLTLLGLLAAASLTRRRARAVRL